jgi:cobalamin biosynthesis Mg chelatase CobN
MKTGRVRASALLAGVATACAIPGVAAGQIDPGKVGDTVEGVTKQVPQVPPQVQKQLPSLPVTQSPSSGSKGSAAPHSQAPSSAGGSGNSGATSTRSSTSSSGSARSDASSAGSSGVKAHAASSKQANKGAASGQAQANPADKQAEVSNVASTARPDTGTAGDPKLPFTGYALIVVGVLGLMALLTGAGLRGLTRVGFSRKRA